MSGFLVFLVAFAGVGGKHADKIDHQVGALFAEQAEVQRVHMSKADRHELVTRGDGAADIIAATGAKGVIAGEVDRSGKKPVLRVVVYDAEGTMLDLVELTLQRKAKKLAASDLESIREVVMADVELLTAPPPPEPEPAPAPVVEAEPVPEAIEVVARAPRARREARVKVSAGAGARSRRFEPGPAMVLGYRSSQVPGAQVAAEVRPVKYVAIAAELDRTLVMSSQVDAESLPSSILGWQATAAGRLALGPIELAVLAGVGARHFVIESATPAPTPDGHYVHAVLGGRISARLGARVELRAFGAYEPVIGGDDTMMSGATRTGLEVGGAIEVAATPHVFVVGEAGFQRFTSTWDSGSATDDYPGATLSMGAQF